MTKKKPEYKVDVDLSDLFGRGDMRNPDRNAMTVSKALEIVEKHMRAAGLRERTISDYRTHVTHFANTTGNPAINELTADHVYEWLASMNVSNSTKSIRLKCLKAFFSRCFDNGWIETKFWRNITIRVDRPVKEGATDREVKTLLSVLDLTDFVQLRDAVAILTMYQCGLRVGTLVKLENKHVDLDEKVLKIGGELLKNHSPIYLPFDDTLAKLFSVLMTQNEKIRRTNGVRNDWVFITRRGTPISAVSSHNNIRKRLSIYAKKYGLKNINPHALRRGFAKNLLNKGADLTLISKALGHSDFAVTARYLHIDKEEVVENLRKFLN